MRSSKARGSLILFVCLLFVAVITVGSFTQTASANAYEQIDLTISEIDRQINASLNFDEMYYVNGLPLALSSNPYDYVFNNSEYDKLVAIGPDAIEAIEEGLRNPDKYASLDRYILAIAMEDIVKIALKRVRTYEWQDADTFLSSWSNLKEAVKTEIPQIIGDKSLSEDEKWKEISKFGILSIDPLKEIQQQMASTNSTARVNAEKDFITDVVDFLSTASRDTVVEKAIS